jgi:glutamyl-tRNA synthetase
LPPVYDRASLRLSEAEKTAYLQSGRKPHYRFRLDDAPIEWTDLIRGPVRFQAGHMSDPVLVREDGVPLYTFASVVDDIDMRITHVIRGEDHVSNTAVQTQIFTALGATPPEFGHLALLKTKDGELSKRVGGNDIRGLREAGIEPMAVCSLLATIGTSDPVAPFPTMKALAARFDFARFGRAPANYDAAELERLNAKLLGNLSFAQIQPRLAALGLERMDETFWLSVRGNLATLPDVTQWWDIVHNPDFAAPAPTEPDYLRQAAALLPPAPWDATVWDRWIAAIKAATSRKGKDLFLPLRLAITGREHGPELKHLLPILGFDATFARLHA